MTLFGQFGISVMDKRSMQRLAQIMGIITVLFFIAPNFQILPWNIATFIGIASALLTGTLWSFAGRKE